MNKQISRKARFITTGFPEEVVAKLRRDKPYMPISVGIIVIDQQFKNMVVATPKAKYNLQETCAPVPIQERLSEEGSPNRLATALSYALLAGRICQDDMRYLGYGHGQHRQGSTCQKYGKCVLWFGFCAPSDIRRRGNAKLHKVANFSSPRWMEIKRWQALHSGSAVSDSKFRMAMQAILVLSEKNGINNSTVARAHQELSVLGIVPQAISA